MRCVPLYQHTSILLGRGRAAGCIQLHRTARVAYLEVAHQTAAGGCRHCDFVVSKAMFRLQRSMLLKQDWYENAREEGFGIARGSRCGSDGTCRTPIGCWPP
jgi:hypothetical protein